MAWAALETAPASIDHVDAWWRRWPAANIGVLTGTVSGIVVLDVDPRNGGDASLVAVQERWGTLPETPQVRTGGNGRHLWFRAPGTPVVSHPVASGLDLKGEGGLVVVPPSVHSSGARYEWLPGRDPDAVPLGAAAAWFVEPPIEPAPASARAGDVARTESERAEFAELWRMVGVALLPGDQQYLCPFHADHHPSLHIDADGCRWYCFGCRRGGGTARLRDVLGILSAPSRRDRVTSAPGLPAPAAVTLPGSEIVNVVGESLHQDALLGLTGGRRHYGGADAPTVARLVPDPDNPADPHAIAVLIGGHPVGWLTRSDAERYRDLITAARAAHGQATCAARIRGGWDRGADDVGRFGVVLLLPPAATEHGSADRTRSSDSSR